MMEATHKRFARFSRWVFASAVVLLVVGFGAFVSGVLEGLGGISGRGNTPFGKAMINVGLVCMAMAEIANVATLVTSLMGWERGRGSFPYIIVPISGIVVAGSLVILACAIWG
jgi:putative copper export protein